jgi:hypothetical protein
MAVPEVTAQLSPAEQHEPADKGHSPGTEKRGDGRHRSDQGDLKMNTKTNVEISELSMQEMEAFSGGGATLSLSTSILRPHLPEVLLTQQQIASLLSAGSLNPQVPRG